jgi:HPt (histidine-containing phosphotransfer) domain-containing protein
LQTLYDVESGNRAVRRPPTILGEWGTIIVGPHVDREAHTLHACEHDVTTRRVPPVIPDPWDQIRKRFVERCRGDLHRLRESRSTGAYRDSAEALSVLAAVAHSLAGAGGTFGFPEISSRAVELETLLMEGKIDDRARAVLDQLIQVLETVSGRSD